MENKKKKFIIIDGNALVHRAFHALPPFTTKDGKLVNAVYGFTSILLKVIKDLKPDYMAVTYDLKGPTFRDTLFTEYKAHRAKQPDELYEQIPLTQEVAASFHIPIYTKQGFEADDVIGTLCKHKDIDTKTIETIIVTGDMDTLQLVDDNTKVFTMKRGVNDTVLYGEQEVRDRYNGLVPEQLIDYKALRGDPSDNIPGIKGIGEKGAIELIKNFKTLENLYRELEKETPSHPIKERTKKLLTEQKQNAFLSKKLATIVTDVPIAFDMKSCETVSYDSEKVFSLFSRLGFKSLLARLPTEDVSKLQPSLFSSEKPEQGKHNYSEDPLYKNYTLVQGEKDIKEFLQELSKQTCFAIDTETDALDAIESNLLGISFSWKEKTGAYVDYQDLKKYPKFVKKLQGILKNSKIKKMGHNIKYDLNVLIRAGLDLEGIAFDSMIASYLLNPGARNNSLEGLAFSEFGHRMIPIESLIGKGKDQKSMRDVDVNLVAIYSAEDADFTWRLCNKFRNELKEKGVEKVFVDIDMPLVPVLAVMERSGIRIDIKKLAVIKKDLQKRIAELEKEIYNLAGETFNINSPLQLKEIIFTKLKISTANIKKIKTGISTAASELEKLKGKHPIIDKISEYREYAKLLNTYVEALPLLVKKSTGRIHTSFNQTITATGRLSSSDPNLQNIPIKTEEGQKIRGCFVAAKGYSLLSLDYSQIELRIVASLAQDKNMIEIFRTGKDIHAATAAEIFGVPLGQVTKTMRNSAKTVNFGVLYGMGAYGLAQGTGMSHDEASAFIEKYFLVFKDVAKYLEETKEFARKQGFVETLFGRRRYIPEINSGVMQVRRSAERMAINMPVQGTEADLIKMAMIQIHKLKEKKSNEIKMLLQVHDELVFEVKKGKEISWAQKLKNIMENIFTFKVPIIVDAKYGDNWEIMKVINRN